VIFERNIQSPPQLLKVIQTYRGFEYCETSNFHSCSSNEQRRSEPKYSSQFTVNSACYSSVSLPVVCRYDPDHNTGRNNGPQIRETDVLTVLSDCCCRPKIWVNTHKLRRSHNFTSSHQTQSPNTTAVCRLERDCTTADRTVLL